MNPPAEQQPRRPKRQQQQHARVAPTASTSSSKPSSDDEQERRTPTLNTTLSELALDIEDDYASSSHESDDDDEDHASSFHAPPHADSSDSEDDDDGAPAQVQSKHQLHIDTARLSSPPSQRLRERSHSSPAISTTPHGTTSTAGKRTEHWVDKAILRQLALESLESVDGEQEAVSRLANLVVPGGGGATRPRVRERSHTSAVDQLEPSSPAENKRRDKERLETVRKEFGWSCADEELVAEVPCALYRMILVKGLCVLTTRRLCYLGYIAPLEPGKVIHDGFATIHTPGLLVKPTRAWFELKSDSLTWYPSSTTLYRPIGFIRLSQLQDVAYDADKAPNDLTCNLLDRHARTLTFDTPESARTWHSRLLTTLFTFRANADQIRLCIPLHRVTQLDRQDFWAHASSVTIEFDTSNNASEEARIGFLKTHDDFYTQLARAVAHARASPPETDCEPVIEVESAARKQEDEMVAQVAKETLSQRATRLINALGLKEDDPQKLLVLSAQLVQGTPNWGEVAISSQYLCFWRHKLVGRDIKVRVPLADVEDAVPVKAWGFRIFGLAVLIRSAPDLRLDFLSRASRDSVIERIKELKRPAVDTASTLSSSATTRSSTVVLGRNIIEDMRYPDLALHKMPPIINAVGDLNIPSQLFVCLTIGSRGDVQPYIALCLELQKRGHRTTIVSHPEYRDWVEGHGIAYRDAGGDPSLLMKLSVEHKMLSPAFLKVALLEFRKWLDDLLVESWEASQDADVLIESPQTMAGIHCAEALGIPYFRAFTMPWTRTSVAPHAFAPIVDLGPSYNLLSYYAFETTLWRASASQINRWRRKTLKLPRTNLHALSQGKVPFLYNFSSAVLPKPNDWPDYIAITGYWHLESASDWLAPEGLTTFMDKARKDGKPLVYIGFGSIVVPDAEAVTRAVVASVLAADVRAILVKGWSERGSAPQKEQVELPEEIYAMDSVPHDKLFPLIDAAVHHGGAGTTGASLRAGLPTLIHPFFGDQHFWALRVTRLGAGLRVDHLTEKDLTAALKRATSDRVMKEKAEDVGAKIRAENGPAEAVRFLHEYMDYALSRTHKRAKRAREAAEPKRASTSATNNDNQDSKTSGAASPSQSQSHTPSVLTRSPMRRKSLGARQRPCSRGRPTESKTATAAAASGADDEDEGARRALTPTRRISSTLTGAGSLLAGSGAYLYRAASPVVRASYQRYFNGKRWCAEPDDLVKHEEEQGEEAESDQEEAVDPEAVAAEAGHRLSQLDLHAERLSS